MRETSPDPCVLDMNKEKGSDPFDAEENDFGHIPVETKVSPVLSSWLVMFTAVLALMIPVLYLYGFLTNIGYLGAFNVDVDLYPRNFEYFLVQSYSTILFQTIDIDNNYWFFVSISIAISALFFFLVFISYGLDRWFEKIPTSNGGAQAWYKVAMRENKSTAKAAVFFLLIPLWFLVFKIMFLVTALPMVYGESLAKESISSFEKCIKEKKFSPELCSNYISVKKVGEPEMVGLLVASSPTMISIYDHKNKRTSTFKLNSTTVIDTYVQ